MKTILLHVGTHKTGSTSLQRTFNLHQDTLKSHGILYLGGDGAYPHLYPAFLTNPMNFEWDVLTGLSVDELRARNDAVLAELTGLIEASTAETVIISSEYLSKLNHHELENLRDFLAPHGRVIAIYYYRELLSWMSSDSQQMSKVGFRSQPTTYDTAIQRIYDMPLRVYEVFGAENSHFIRFESAVKAGLCNTFLSEFNLPTLSSQGMSELHSNESISADAVRAMYVYNRLFPLGSTLRRKNALKRLHALEGPKYMLDGITEEQVIDYTKKRGEVVATLGLNLLDSSQIPVSEVLDPAAKELLHMINRYILLKTD